jgi:hypothetical protein
VQAGHDLSSISFFQRGTAQEFITFTSRILVERTALGARQSVKEHGSSNTVEEHGLNPKKAIMAGVTGNLKKSSLIALMFRT